MTPLAVYIHIPFCTVKCGYCDFNAYAGMDALKSAYTRALLGEIRLCAPLLREARVTSIAFGGGTPGEMPADDLAAVLAAVRAHAGAFASDAEVSIEANPGTTSQEALGTLVAAGVTRVSFGAQTFDPAGLRFLDRIHSPEAIGAAVRNARAAGIASVGLDLIYGLPAQDVPSWLEDVDRALALASDHLSLYALTVEEGTPLARRVASGEIHLPGDDELADLYEAARTRLALSGFEQYEISNWARPGHESRHNSVYWTGGDYLGLGAGAHGYVAGSRRENIAHPRDYIAAVAAGQAPLAHAYTPQGATAIVDYVQAALRLRRGMDLEAFAARFGQPFEAVAGPLLVTAEAAGVLERTATHLRLTPRGLLLHGEVVAELLAHLSQAPAAAP